VVKVQDLERKKMVGRDGIEPPTPGFSGAFPEFHNRLKRWTCKGEPVREEILHWALAEKTGGAEINPYLLLVPAASRFLRDPDLLGEHADV
jgi:hypothetical protein